MIDYYTPNVLMPMLRRIYPTMMSASSITPMTVPGKVRDRIWENEVNKLRGCGFLSRNRIKNLLKGWRPNRLGIVYINVVEYENFEPAWKTMQAFQIPDKKEEFIVELANLSDLHGIIRMSGSEIWVRKVNDQKELNIDDVIMDRIFTKLDLERM